MSATGDLIVFLNRVAKPLHPVIRLLPKVPSKPMPLASHGPSVPLEAAWDPLPPGEWNAAAARHLLRRAGWSARPEEVEQAESAGLPATLDQLFPRRPSSLEAPAAITALAEARAEWLQRMASTPPGPERQALQREARQRSRDAVADLMIAWLQHAARPEHAAMAKWVHFLGDVYVVSHEKVRDAALIFQHQQVLFEQGLGPAPALTKAASRSPAMMRYLDLTESRAGAPNENFARELFELFLLGEGNYSEQDVKEAARAFTGYRFRDGRVRLARQHHDAGTKVIFGRTGPWDGDDVIDLAYQQPGAATFLPAEMARFYLSTSPLPDASLAALGAEWRGARFDLRWLLQRFFGSRIFFDPAFRGNQIKSPLQFYLGLVHDLQLDVLPLPRVLLNHFRQMGQLLFHPPNVRGWVGGRTWINSATLNARRQVVQALLSPLEEDRLTADDAARLAAARAAGAQRFSFDWGRIAALADSSAEETARSLTTRFGGGTHHEDAVGKIARFLSPRSGAAVAPERLRAALATVLQSPFYQLT